MIKDKGFTLIEILIVISIVMIVAGLILASFGQVRETVDVTETKRRMLDIQRRFSEVATGSDRVATIIQDIALGKKYRWRTLHRVLSSQSLSLKSEVDVGMDFSKIKREGAMYQPLPVGKHLPPGLASVLATGSGEIGNFYANGAWCDDGGASWVRLEDDRFDGLGMRSRSLKNVIAFMNYKNFWGEGDAGSVYVKEQVPVMSEAALGCSDVLPRLQNERTHWWIFTNDRVQENMADNYRACNLIWYQSPNGESLRSTKELSPFGDDYEVSKKVTGEWYLEQWPILSEVLLEDGETLRQTAWPNSDWNQSIPGDIAPIIEAPFGRPIIGRHSGTQSDQHLVRLSNGKPVSLEDFSPLNTIDFLVYLELAANPNVVRSDRNRNRIWNDRWGNPLVISHLAYIAPRYGFDPAGDEASHGLSREYSSDLRGGRDYLMDRANQEYGFARASYISIGSVGDELYVAGSDNNVAEELPFEPPLRWEESKDDLVLRALWLQVLDKCDGGQFISTNPAWSGFRVRRNSAGGSAILQAPVEYNK